MNNVVTGLCSDINLSMLCSSGEIRRAAVTLKGIRAF